MDKLTFDLTFGSGAVVRSFVCLLALPLSCAAAYAQEDCLAYLHHEQQIACLSRENETLRSKLAQLSVAVEKLSSASLQYTSQIRLRNKAYAGVNSCLDNDSGDVHHIQGWTCSPNDFQLWIVERP